jgi:hypothetical protein
MSQSEDHPTDISATRARQGRWGRSVLWVLITSTTLAVAALIGAWYFQSAKLASAPDTERPSSAQVAHYAPPVGPMRAPG